MAIRRTTELVVAQAADGTWAQREIYVVQRFRVRVLSDRAFGSQRKTIDQQKRQIARLTAELAAVRAGQPLPEAPRVDADPATEVRDTNHRAGAHRYGHGEEFELVVDGDLDVWVRPFGQVTPFRKDEDAYAVSLLIVENVTLGVLHEIRTFVKPGDPDHVEWTCACGVGSRGKLTAELAQEAATAHLSAIAEQDRIADRIAAERTARVK